ncbi:unnamed protein product, partial [Symbiodinium sp. KB8]
SIDAPRCAADASSTCEELGEVSTLQVKGTGAGSRAVQAEAPEIVIPGLGPGGNPDPALTVDDVTFDQETVSCTDPKWKPDANEVWTFEQIAESFLIYGAKKFYKPGTGPDPLTQCLGALITAAGTCVPKLGIGCDARATGPSGVFQLDFLRSGGAGRLINTQIKKDHGLMNLCISGFGVGFITAAPWVDRANGRVATLQGDSYLTCMGAPAFVNNYSCPDPKAYSDRLYENFLGPFCHKGYATRLSPCKLEFTYSRCCGVWNGGANHYQIPFPVYYLEKAQENLKAGADFVQTCQEALENVSWGEERQAEESELEESTGISSRTKR